MHGGQKRNIQIVKCYLLIKPEIKDSTYFIWLTNVLSLKGEKSKEVSWIVLFSNSPFKLNPLKKKEFREEFQFCF